MTLTAERLRELLDYDPAAGVFRWKDRRGARAANSIAGTIDEYGYRRIAVDRYPYLAHRLAWLYVHGEWPQGDLDHRDTNRDRNAIGNLRLATMSQNRANSRKSRVNTSGFKGVYFQKASQKWAADIKLNGKKRYLGCFATTEEAHAAYIAKAKELFGEFARAA